MALNYRDVLSGDTLFGTATPQGVMGVDVPAANRDGMMALAASLLAGSGPQPHRTSFGQHLGHGLQAALAARAQALQRQQKQRLIEAQIEAMKPQPVASKRYVVNGALVDENGVPVYTAPPKTELTDAEEKYAAIQRLKAEGATDADPRVQALSREIEMLGTRAPGISVNVGDKLPTPPQGQRYVKDPKAPGGYRLENIQGARDQRSEGERKAALFADRMEQLSSDILDKPPNAMSQKAFEIAQEGGLTGAAANRALSAPEQKHFNAARGWLAGILRNDTGATITAEEFRQYYPTYFPVPGDTKEVIEQKRQLRLKTQQGVRANSGVYTGDGSPANEPHSDNIVNWDDL